MRAERAPTSGASMTAREVLDITSRLEELSRIRDFLHVFCETYTGEGFTEEYMAQLELAVNEAATNVMKHAYHGREGQPIQVEAHADPGRVVIVLLHHGDSFTPESVPPPAFDGSRSNGFGVFLIRNCVDEVRYTTDDQGRNAIYMVKSYPV
jgi:serine/threonine-protein kinase RsbW